MTSFGTLFVPQVLGGRFSSVMPSNVVRPGAFAKHSLPARARIHGKTFGPQYGTGSELLKIQGFRIKCGPCSPAAF